MKATWIERRLNAFVQGVTQGFLTTNDLALCDSDPIRTPEGLLCAATAGRVRTFVLVPKDALARLSAASPYLRIKPGYVETGSADGGTCSFLLHQGKQRTRLVLSESAGRDVMNGIRQWLRRRARVQAARKDGGK